MTDEALHWDNAGGTGNLSNVPLHMADLGTDNYDQEFTLGLIENEQGTLELVNRGPEPHGKRDIRAMRGVRRADLQAAAPGDPLRAALHSAVHGSWRVANEGGRERGSRSLDCFSGRSPLGGTAFDLVTKSIVFSRVGPPACSTGRDRAEDPRAAHQSEHRCTLGLRSRVCRAAA